MINDNAYYLLSNIANVLGIASYELNIRQISNDELLKYLEHQDQDFLKTIIEQNNTIIEQNEKLLDLLKGE